MCQLAKVSILGTGGFGVSLAATCYKYGHQVTLWGLFPDEVNAIIRDGEHKKLLPGVPVNPGIRVTADIGEAAGADLLILAVPSFAVRETAARAKPILGEKTVVVSVAKGLEPGTGKLLSDVIEEELPVQAVILSGPSHAEEIARGVPTTVDAASRAGQTPSMSRTPCRMNGSGFMSATTLWARSWAGRSKTSSPSAPGCATGWGSGTTPRRR